MLPFNINKIIKLRNPVLCLSKNFSVIPKNPLILGIETSCDDTGAAIINGDALILGEAIHSQQDTHLKFGGIIPPIAQDLHRQNIERVVTECLQNANVQIRDVDAIAVTNRPGLPLSLVIGVRYAKYLARHNSKPIIPIHHMEAHALTARMTHDIQFPFLCLLCSGGHCLITLVKSVDKFYLLGETLDDAPGEAFDKIARRLKIRNIPEYAWMSGGAAIEAAAKLSKNPTRFDFPLPLAQKRDCQFSFAGLKNTARRHIMKCELGLGPDEVIPEYNDFCYGFLHAITRHISHRTQRAIEYCEYKALFENVEKKKIIFGGGVACNDFLYTAISQMAHQFGFETIRPSKKYCTDNGVMIAWNGIERFLINKDIVTDLNSITIDSKCPLGTSIIKDVQETNLSCKWVKIPILREAIPSKA